MLYEVEDHVVEDASIYTTLGVKDGYIRRLYPTPVVKDGGRTKMLPKFWAFFGIFLCFEVLFGHCVNFFYNFGHF